MKTTNLVLSPSAFDEYIRAQRSAGGCSDGSCLACKIDPLIEASVELQIVFARMAVRTITAMNEAVDSDVDSAKVLTASIQIFQEVFAMGFVTAHDMIQAANLAAAFQEQGQ